MVLPAVCRRVREDRPTAFEEARTPSTAPAAPPVRFQRGRKSAKSVMGFGRAKRVRGIKVGHAAEILLEQLDHLDVAERVKGTGLRIKECPAYSVDGDQRRRWEANTHLDPRNNVCEVNVSGAIGKDRPCRSSAKKSLKAWVDD